MINESAPWKRELRRLKSQLRKLSSKPVNDEIADFQLERPVLYSAVVVRRLIESQKVTDKTRAREYPVEFYPTRLERHDALLRQTMRGDIEKEFDLEAPQPGVMDAWNITSELLHGGFVNWDLGEEEQLTGIFVTSKRNHMERLVRIPLSEYF